MLVCLVNIEDLVVGCIVVGRWCMGGAGGSGDCLVGVSR